MNLREVLSPCHPILPSTSSTEPPRQSLTWASRRYAFAGTGRHYHWISWGRTARPVFRSSSKTPALPLRSTTARAGMNGQTEMVRPLLLRISVWISTTSSSRPRCLRQIMQIMDALMALWCCNMWGYSAEHTARIDEGREGGEPDTAA